jgi:hypothetical protein
VQETNQKMKQIQEIHNIENVLSVISTQHYNTDEVNLLKKICQKSIKINSLSNPEKQIISQIVQQLFLSYIIFEQQQQDQNEKLNI